jgi:hypothetical protein
MDVSYAKTPIMHDQGCSPLKIGDMIESPKNEMPIVYDNTTVKEESDTFSPYLMGNKSNFKLMPYSRKQSQNLAI